MHKLILDYFISCSRYCRYFMLFTRSKSSLSKVRMAVTSRKVGNIGMGVKFPYLIETALDSWLKESANMSLSNG